MRRSRSRLSLPTASGTRKRRGWVVAGRFKDDGFSAYKEIARDDFVRLVSAIEAGELDVVIVWDVDRLTRNLTDWNRFEKACVRHGVLLSPYTAGTWTCPPRKAPTTAGRRRCAPSGKARSRAPASARLRNARHAPGSAAGAAPCGSLN
jgi:hypothetical protein